jgi:putative ABC transport system substrate-binding protein
MIPLRRAQLAIKIGRRQFISALGGAIAALPLAVRAQQSDRMRRIGVLSGFAEGDPIGQSLVAAFRRRLAELGWTEDRNVRFDVRWAAAGDLNLMRSHAIELVEMAPDLILVHGSRALAAVQRQTRHIPIVFASVPDPVASKQVESLARPGGNATGFTTFEGSRAGKLAEVLKDTAPGIGRVALIINPDVPEYVLEKHAFEQAAPVLGVKPVVAPVRSPAEIEQAIEMFGHEPNGGLVLLSDLTITTYRKQIIALAAHYRLPAVYGRRDFVADGGLISYGFDLAENYRSAASYVDRILKGEKPEDLPVQQPTKFELVINLKTAKALGLDIPPAVLARADEVIE